jgi:aminopeptidase N
LAVCGACALVFLALFPLPPRERADEPYAPTRDYDLQNIRTHLWFDLDQRTIRGEATESISTLHDNVSQLRFDSVDLKIDSVSVDGKTANYSTTPNSLMVSLEHPAAAGEKHEVLIRYGGHPKKGVYFILPDKNYPQQPKEIWTQGEAEDTRYYIPIYDYPNDRTTSEMLLTVPGTWLTISNGRLIGVKSEADGTKTWDWKQSEPLSTYLISAIAGEFAEKDDSWDGIPLRYVVPRGEEQDIDPTFSRTKQMLDLFSKKLDIPYPWAQYSQTFVDFFVEGGMENTSATTLTSRELVNPMLAPEERTGADTVESHELAHQWFGDLVTCKDWANLWLNEGFATYFEHYWMEQHYGADNADYEFWREQAQWFRDRRMFPAPIVNRDISDSVQYEGNVYTKGGWVLRMLREQIGDDNFFRALHHYLDSHRGQNVVTADLQKSIEEATNIDVDEFFHQWLYRAGAPQFEVNDSYDSASNHLDLTVKQVQKVEGLVGIFDVPVTVEIATASGNKTYPIRVNQAAQTFTLPVDGAPLMVIFDKGDQILKSVDFKKSTPELIYQLKHAETVPDRADAAMALGNLKGDSDAVAALGDAAVHDPFWGIRVESLRALGRIGGTPAETQILSAVNDEKPWVRDVAVGQLGHFKDDAVLPSQLTEIAAQDKAYRVRAAALGTLAQIHAPRAYDTLVAAVKSDSPNDILRNAGLEGLGTLGDDRAVPLLLDWTALGKPLDSRQAAILAVANLDKKNKNITNTLVSYLHEPHFDVNFWVIYGLGSRGDPDAIAPLEDLLKGDDLSMGERSVVERQVAKLKSGGVQ